MKQRPWGRIITLTSQAVKQPVENLILSNAVRASVVGLMKTLASERASYITGVSLAVDGGWIKNIL